MLLRLAMALNCSAMEAEAAPMHLKYAAMTDMEWQRLESERASKRHRRGAGKPAANPRHKR